VTAEAQEQKQMLSDLVLNSPIAANEDGAAMRSSEFEFGVDPSMDPELALVLSIDLQALRMSLEEEQARLQRQGGSEANSLGQQQSQSTGHFEQSGSSIFLG
jgi:26S proteasome regulatory subunit N10